MRRLHSRVLGFSLCLSGCFSGKVAPRELYRLTVRDTLAVPLSGTRTAPALVGAIAIVPYDAPGMYGETHIAYRVNDAEYGAYPNRDWAMPLGEMLGMLTERVLTDDPLAAGGAVYDPRVRRAFAYEWRGRVREFDEVDRGKTVFAAVALDVQLVRVADDSVIWSGAARQERLVEQPSMEHIVQTLSDLAAECVASLADRARTGMTGT